jgi:predicted transcriptional regulator
LWNHELLSRFLNEGEKQMTRDALLKKLATMLASAEADRMYGQIEIEIKDGEPTLLRKATTERLDTDRERTRGQAYR